MATSINSKYLKVFNARNFKNSVSGDSGANVYLTIGKSSPWENEVVPDDTDTSVSSFSQYWRDMIGGKKIVTSDISHAIPKFPWVRNRRFAEYDDLVDSNDLKKTTTNFFVVTPEQNVYKCLSNNYSAQSSVMPSQTSPTTPDFQTDDGYIWKYMYTITTSDNNRFTTSNFVPVKTIQLNDNSLQWQVQNNAIDGAIHVIKVTNGGTNYPIQIGKNFEVRSVGGDLWSSRGSANTSAARGGLFINGATDSAPHGANNSNSIPGYGYNLWVIDRSNGNIVFAENYNTYGDYLNWEAWRTANVGNAAAYQYYSSNGNLRFDRLVDNANSVIALSQKLDSIDSNNIIVLQTFYDPTPFSGLGNLGNSIINCGGSKAIFGDRANVQFYNDALSDGGAGWVRRAAYALVGIPGISEGSGIELYGGNVGTTGDYTGYFGTGGINAHANIIFSIVEGQLISGTYTDPLTVTITGDGAGAEAKAVVNANTRAVSSIVVTNRGYGYSYANVSISSVSTGTGATARAIMSPKGGHGSDPLTELGGSYLVINPELNQSEGGIISTTNDFRQVGLLQDPKFYGSTQISSNLAVSQLTVLTVDVADTGFLTDEYVYQGPSLSTATFGGVITEWDSANNKMKLSNVRGVPSINQPIVGTVSNGIRTVTSYQNPDLQPFTGKLLYINNIGSITRAPDQIEDFKIILSF